MQQHIVDHLFGMQLPSVMLAATDGSIVNLSAGDGVTVVYAYPRTSPPDQPPIEGWYQIPGARGCTSQSKEFAVHYDDIIAAGAKRVFGLSTQDTAYQSEMKVRLHLPFEILSDADLAHVIHPVNNPASNPAEVLAYLRGLEW